MSSVVKNIIVNGGFKEFKTGANSCCVWIATSKSVAIKELNPFTPLNDLNVLL